MKLIRFGAEGSEKPGILVGEKRYDVSSIVTDYNESFFEKDGIKRLHGFRPAFQSCRSAGPFKGF